MTGEDTKNRSEVPSATRRTAIKSIAGVAGIGVGALTLPDLASAAAGEYIFRNEMTGKVLDATGDNHGAYVIQWDYWGGDNQKWFMTKSGNEYTFKNVDSGLVLGVVGSRTRNGADVIVRDPGIGPHQSWNLTPEAWGGYSFQYLNSSKVITVGFSFENGTRARLTDPGGVQTYDEWKIEEV